MPVRLSLFMNNSSRQFSNNPGNLNFEKDLRKPEILIFSKETDTLLLLKTMLGMWDFMVEGIVSIPKLLISLESKIPDLIIFDFNFPFDEYLKTIKAIRQEFTLYSIPIIGISGFSQTRYKNLAIAFGADEYLIKPIDFDQLKACLINHLKNNCKLDRHFNTFEPYSGGRQ